MILLTKRTFFLSFLLAACLAKLKVLKKNLTINCIPPQCNITRDSDRSEHILPFTKRDKNLMGFGLVDSKNRILLDWTPKAACTMSVKMFMDHMGIREHEHYEGWVHELKTQIYYHKCGRANVCTYENPTWYKFKIVRNPYDRAVSSYLHTMKTPHAVDEAKLLKHIPSARTKDDVTFEKFVFAMDYTRARDPLLINGHIRKQALDAEYILFQQGKPYLKLFNRIVKLESMAEDMKLVNYETGMNFSTDFKSHHYYPRNEGETHFVGNWTWTQLQKNVPANYGHFYNNATREQVAHLFQQDLELYNYSFPFELF